MINPQPRRNWFFVWFIIPLRAKVKGKGSNFFSKTAPTVQFESSIPRKTKLALGKSTYKRKQKKKQIKCQLIFSASKILPDSLWMQLILQL